MPRRSRVQVERHRTDPLWQSSRAELIARVRELEEANFEAEQRADDAAADLRQCQARERYLSRLLRAVRVLSGAD